MRKYVNGDCLNFNVMYIYIYIPSIMLYITQLKAKFFIVRNTKLIFFQIGKEEEGFIFMLA